MKLFRDDLDEDDVVAFKKWARENYKPMSEIKGVWHPIIQEECVRMNEEAGEDISGLFDSFLTDTTKPL